MTIGMFLGIVVAVALGVALAPRVPALLRFLHDLVWLLTAVGGVLGALALMLVGVIWRQEMSGLGLWYVAAIVVLGVTGMSAFKLMAWRSNRCPICKVTLFVGGGDPLDHYVAGKGGWGGVPLAVHIGSWLTLRRRQWYHQTCCGIYTDGVDRDGRWYIFGFTTSDAKREAKRETR